MFYILVIIKFIFQNLNDIFNNSLINQLKGNLFKNGSKRNQEALIKKERDLNLTNRLKLYFQEKNNSAQRKLTSEEKFLGMWENKMTPRKSLLMGSLRKSLLLVSNDKTKNETSPKKEREEEEEGLKEENNQNQEIDSNPMKLPAPRYMKRVYTMRPFLGEQDSMSEQAPT